MSDPDRGPLLIRAVVREAPEAHAFGGFCRAFLGWEAQHEEVGWLRRCPPHRGAGLAVHSDPDHVRPDWPGAAGSSG